MKYGVRYLNFFAKRSGKKIVCAFFKKQLTHL
jgi:hypothetical protein